MGETVEIDILANVTQAVSGLQDLIVKAAAAYLSFNALKQVVKEAVQSFIEDEQATTRLNAALQITGQYSDSTSKQIRLMAEALQSHTTFAHDATEAAAGMLMEIGRLTKEGVQEAIPVLQDYAAAMGIDLTTAATQFGAAIEGGRNQFQRYGISLKDAHDPTQRFDELIKGLKEKFSGLADAMGKTTGGQIEIFKNQMHDALAGITEDFLKFTNAVHFLQGFNLETIAQKITPEAIIGADLETLKQYQKVLMDLIHNLQTSKLSFLYGGEIKTTQDQLVAVTQQMKALMDAAHGKSVPDVVLGDKPEEVSTYLEYWQMHLKTVHQEITAFSDANEAVLSDQIAAEQRAVAYMKEEADLLSGNVDMTGTTNGPEAEQAIANATWDQVSATEAVLRNKGLIVDSDKLALDLLKQQEKQIADISSTMQTIASNAVTIGTYLAEGDWGSALKSLIDTLAEALITQATIAAANAYVKGDYAAMAVWAAIAGLAVVAEIGASLIDTGTTTDTTTTTYPTFATGGTVWGPTLALVGENGPEDIVPHGSASGVNIHVYGGVWQSDDLARKVAHAMGKW